MSKSNFEPLLHVHWALWFTPFCNVHNTCWTFNLNHFHTFHKTKHFPVSYVKTSVSLPYYIYYPSCLDLSTWPRRRRIRAVGLHWTQLKTEYSPSYASHWNQRYPSVHFLNVGGCNSLHRFNSRVFHYAWSGNGKQRGVTPCLSKTISKSYTDTNDNRSYECAAGGLPSMPSVTYKYVHQRLIVLVW